MGSHWAGRERMITPMDAGPSKSDRSSPPVRWTEVRILTPAGWEELIADHLASTPVRGGFAFGITSVGQEPPPGGMGLVRTYLRAEDDEPATRQRVRECLGELAALCAEPELARIQVDFHPLPPEDYATSWRKSWRPFRVLQLCVLPPWRKEDEGAQPRPGDRVLRLEPGGAFGSGRHATTRTCLKVLQQRLKGGERVLDAGSGSGILSVTAALLGAGSCTGFDIQDEALDHAVHLASDNGVEERCDFRLGGFETLTDADREHDVVLANIYSDVIQEHARELADRLSRSGWFAFSGCPIHHAEATRAAIRGAGLTIEEDLLRGRWHTFVGRHTSG